MITLLSPSNDKTVILHTDVQDEFISNYDTRQAIIDEYAAIDQRPKDDSLPHPVRFEWEDKPTDRVFYYMLLVSQSPDMSHPISVVTDKCHAEVYNLCIGTTYYWCVQTTGAKRSEVGRFVTCGDAPRWLYLDGASNVRDLGGYKVPNGIIKQGMLYRGGTIDTIPHLTNKGVRQFLDLGIKTELDLREESLYRGQTNGFLEPFGVNYCLKPIYGYGGFIGDQFKENANSIFNDILSNKDMYPIYFHCHVGADRTGTLAFVIGALLGMTKKELVTEYELTSLSPAAGVRSRLSQADDEVIRYLFNECPGSTLAEKMIHIITHNLDVTEETLQDIADIMIDRSITV